MTLNLPLQIRGISIINGDGFFHYYEVSIGLTAFEWCFRFFGPVLSKAMQTPPLCDGLRSGHLYLIDAQCTHHVFELLASKNMRKKLNFLRKWPNLQEWSGLIWHWFFTSIVFFLLNTKCFGSFFFISNDIYLERCIMLWSEFLHSWVFLCDS